MAYTREQLIQMGAKPVQGYTREQLIQMGAKPTGTPRVAAPVAPPIAATATQPTQTTPRTVQAVNALKTASQAAQGFNYGLASSLPRQIAGTGIAAENLLRPLAERTRWRDLPSVAVSPAGIPAAAAIAAQKIKGMIPAPYQPRSLAEKYMERTAPKNIAEKAGGLVGDVASVFIPVRAATKVGSAARYEKALLETISPILSKSEKEAAIRAGKGVAQTAFSKGKVVVSEGKRLADAVRGIVNPRKTFIENANNVRSAIAREATQLISTLKKSDGIFNQKQLAGFLNKIEKSPELISDAGVEKAYEVAKNKFMSFVSKNEKNLSGLLKARKEFDAWLADRIPNLYRDQKLTPLRQALKEMRNAGNDYIESRLPAGHPFKGSLQKQSAMYRILENLSEKAVQEIGKTGIQAFMKKHPGLLKAAEWGVVGAAGTVVGGNVLRALKGD